jgi:mevalonate pyrophosphate decarboxylase
MMTNIMVELIKEDENNRIIMNRMLDSKQMKSIRNKLTRMKKEKKMIQIIKKLIQIIKKLI